MDLPPEAIALLAVPPARFTAERAAAARALAGRGDPAAAAVRKLRRPVGLAWVLNRLSRDHPAAVRALLQAGDRLRSGQRRAVSGAGADALRDAEAAVRERARALRLEAERIVAAEGRPAAPPTLARVELLLRVAASGAAREALATGTLAAEPDVGGAGLSGFTLLAGGAAADASPAPAPRPARGGRAAVRGAPAREAREAQAREAQGREARDREARRRDARDAERRRKEQARAVAAAHAAAAKAAARAERAERAADRAERAAREARERAAAARAEASRATARALELERTGG